MSYDEHDAVMDDFYERMSEELYPEHKEQAIEEFIEERMQFYFLISPTIISAEHTISSAVNKSKPR